MPFMKKHIVRQRLAAAAVLAAVVLQAGCAGKYTGGALTQSAEETLENGDYVLAQEQFTQAVAAGEDEVPGYRGLGIACMALGQYDQAVEAFETALSFTDSKMPDTVRDLRLYLISALYRAQKWPDVVTACETLLEDEKLTEGYYYLGAAYLKMGDTAQAREQFDSAAAVSKRDYSLYLQIYERYEEENMTGIGDAYLQTALQIPSESRDDDLRIGQIYYYLGQYDQAKRVLSESVEDRYLPAVRMMGEVYLAQEDFSHALAMYQILRDEGGEKPEVYNGLAQCAIAAGNYDQALDYIGQGLGLQEEEGKQQLRFNEIVVYERKLDFSTAKIKAEAYCTLYPTDEKAQKELAFLNTRV